MLFLVTCQLDQNKIENNSAFDILAIPNQTPYEGYNTYFSVRNTNTFPATIYTTNDQYYTIKAENINTNTLIEGFIIEGTNLTDSSENGITMHIINGNDEIVSAVIYN